MPVVPVTPPRSAPARLRHRRAARSLTTGQLADLREAIRLAQGIDDDRGYQAWSGIHGLPLPIWCQHGSRLFLPWHRAYLLLFERALMDRVPGVTLPWWDWTSRRGDPIPPAYAVKRAGGRANPLFDSPIQAAARTRGGPRRTFREPARPGAPPLPTAQEVARLLALDDFLDFQSQLENIHNGVHVWVGGTMGEVPIAAYDPIFWAHHAMIDRLWRLWQLRHPRGGPPAVLLGRALAPFPLTVDQVLDTDALGYDYAATTTAVGGTP